MFYSDDPVKDYANYDARQRRRLARLPRCSECREPIQDDECFVWDGEIICPECLKENHQKRTEDYIIDEYVD